MCNNITVTDRFHDSEMIRNFLIFVSYKFFNCLSLHTFFLLFEEILQEFVWNISKNYFLIAVSR